MHCTAATGSCVIWFPPTGWRLWLITCRPTDRIVPPSPLKMLRTRFGHSPSGRAGEGTLPRGSRRWLFRLQPEDYRRSSLFLLLYKVNGLSTTGCQLKFNCIISTNCFIFNAISRRIGYPMGVIGIAIDACLIG